MLPVNLPQLRRIILSFRNVSLLHSLPFVLETSPGGGGIAVMFLAVHVNGARISVTDSRWGKIIRGPWMPCAGSDFRRSSEFELQAGQVGSVGATGEHAWIVLGRMAQGILKEIY